MTGQPIDAAIAMRLDAFDDVRAADADVKNLDQGDHVTDGSDAWIASTVNLRSCFSGTRVAKDRSCFD
jgi:hypothetical protein